MHVTVCFHSTNGSQGCEQCPLCFSGGSMMPASKFFILWRSLSITQTVAKDARGSKRRVASPGGPWRGSSILHINPGLNSPAGTLYPECPKLSVFSGLSKISTASSPDGSAILLSNGQYHVRHIKIPFSLGLLVATTSVWICIILNYERHEYCNGCKVSGAPREPFGTAPQALDARPRSPS